MITFISFVLVLVGAVNWFSIGALQYDFIAGFFGSQASILSRIVYFFVGIGALWLVIQAFRGKGNIKINNDGFEKKPRLKESTSEAGSDYAARPNRRQEDYSSRSSEAGEDYIRQDRYAARKHSSGLEFYDVEPIERRDRSVPREEKDYRALGYKDFNEEDLDK